MNDVYLFEAGQSHQGRSLNANAPWLFQSQLMGLCYAKATPEMTS